ncbi:MAG: exodeoxyribonuclease VII small subunit [Phycisphaerae bacterium]|nr:exodeoxyribonuclease VII small subunit [Phycisphaerae bacterium]
MTTPKDKLTFEQSLQTLEEIVAQVEQGKIPLEESIEKYEQGMTLIQNCRKILDQAEKRVEKINQQSRQEKSE